MAALAQNGDGLRADQAGAADDDDLHGFTSHDGFETTATPKPLATGSRSSRIRRMEQSDLAASCRRLRVNRKRPGRRGAHAMPA